MSLAVVQAVIFLCLTIVVIAINSFERRAWISFYELSMETQAMRYGPAAEAAARARELALNIAAEDAFFDANAPADFDPMWLTAILDSDNGNMATLDYNGDFILITGTAGSYEEIEAHRQRLLDSEAFIHVGRGRTSMQDSERVYYELRLRLR